ncbi:MAG: hypothetical protein ABR608_02635 [Pseudonocardiaceae bacterium]
MFPPRTCAALVGHGHDAVHVRDLGVHARPDQEAAAAAAREEIAPSPAGHGRPSGRGAGSVGGRQPAALPRPALAEDRARMWSNSRADPYSGGRADDSAQRGVRARAGRRGDRRLLRRDLAGLPPALAQPGQPGGALRLRRREHPQPYRCADELEPGAGRAGLDPAW